MYVYTCKRERGITTSMNMNAHPGNQRAEKVQRQCYIPRPRPLPPRIGPPRTAPRPLCGIPRPGKMHTLRTRHSFLDILNHVPLLPAPLTCAPRALLPASLALFCSSFTASNSVSGTRRYLIWPYARMHGGQCEIARRTMGRTVLPRM